MIGSASCKESPSVNGYAYGIADGAPDTSDVEGHRGRLGANGDSAKGALLVSADPDIVAAALRAAQSLTLLFDTEVHLTLVEMLADILVANDAEGVIE
jgi:hypothetical protein